MAAITIASSSGRGAPPDLVVVQIDSAADLALIDPHAAPGSRAETADGALKYRKKNNGQWAKVIASSGGEGQTVDVSLDGSVVVVASSAGSTVDVSLDEHTLIIT